MLQYLQFSINCLTITFIIHTAVFLCQTDAEQQNSITYGRTEAAAIKEFRVIVGDKLFKNYMRRDEYLIRWIRDSDFNLERAKSKLLKSLQWRKENNIDNIVNEDYSDLLKTCPLDINGRDKIGRPIFALDLGTCPVRKNILGGNRDRIIRAITQTYERVANSIQDSQLKGGNVTDFILIINLHSLNWREHLCLNCWSYTTAAFGVYEAYYPQYIHKMITINSPRIVQSALEAVRPLMSDALKSSIRVFGHDRAEWSEYLLQLISPDQLERRFGGTKKDNFR